MTRFMSSRSMYSLPISLLTTSLHIACCILPLFSLAAGWAPHLQAFSNYKPIFTTFQILVLLYILVSLLSHYAGIRTFANRRAQLMALLSLFVVLIGLLIGYTEPFKTEQQRLAEQQFHLFKTHRQTTLHVGGNVDRLHLRTELAKLEGVKPKRISFDKAYVRLTYRSDMTSQSQIVDYLRSKGFQVSAEQ
jgi:hypothetical protein